MTILLSLQRGRKSIEHGLTQRALDWWDSAASQSGFNARAFSGTMSLVHARPPASNAHR